jgi:hypothetical protein
MNYIFEIFRVMPISFWVVIVLLGGGFYWSFKNTRRAIGIPAAVLLGTIAVWYVGDALYNDYANFHMVLFPPDILTNAWWQVALFLAVFLLAAPLLHERINRRHLNQESFVFHMFFKRRVDQRQFQRALTVLFFAAACVWICLVIGAVLRFKEDFVYYLFPYLGQHPGPWVLNSVASGADSFLALANYLQLMVGAIFGLVAALSTDTRLRGMAVVGVLLTWPFYILDRTRKFILLVTLPGFLAWVFLRLRGGMLKKAVILSAFCLLINAWFGFIIGHRVESSIVASLEEGEFNFSEASEEKHQGLNMYEELSWINTLTTNGTYEPNMGRNYLANLLNPIPRSLWPGKPTIGLDYAGARGLGDVDSNAGVYATLSDGVVGQGVVNFGRYIGPAFAALLMSFWVCWLARLDLNGSKIGYLPLYCIGLILTFNMGRDITFLELYPFVFGYGISILLNWYLVSRQSTGSAERAWRPLQR